MAKKRITFDSKAREAIRRGVRKLAKAVRVTLGPAGRVVMLQKSWGSATISRPSARSGWKPCVARFSRSPRSSSCARRRW